jgi:hypothetical protein
MKTILSIFLAIATLVIPFSDKAQVVTNFSVNGNQATVGTFHEDACFQTQSNVFLDDRVTTTSNPDGGVFESHTRSLSVFLYQVDLCENKIIMYGNGSIGFVPDDIATTFDKKLNGIHLIINVPVFNQYGPEVNAAIDVTLTAIEDPTISKRVDVVVGPEQRTRQLMNETFRLASATGSIFDGTREYMLGQTQTGGISAFSNLSKSKL